MARVEVGQVYMFERSWDNKRNKESFISKNREGKVIISKQVKDVCGEYKIARIIKEAKNYILVSLGEKMPAGDLFQNICLSDCIEVLKKFGFEVFIRSYDYETKIGSESTTRESQLLAWNEKLGVFVNGGTWDSGNVFNNLYIFVPNLYNTAAGYIGGVAIHESGSDHFVIDVTQSESNKIMSSITKYLRNYKGDKNISLGYVKEGKKKYWRLMNYDFPDSYLGDSAFDDKCIEVFNSLPESGRKFVDDRTKL